MFLLLLLMINLLWGCAEDPPDIPSDLSTERFVYSSRMYGELIRYDVIDKKAVIACPDPLCEHGSDCPVTRIFASYIGDNYVMYGRLDNGLLGGNTIYCYDLKAGNITKVLDCTQFQQITLIDDVAYFSAAHIEYDEDNTPTASVWDAYRYVMSEHQLIKLNETSFANPLVVEGYTDTQLTWRFYGRSDVQYFTTDYDFQDQTPLEDYDNTRIGNYSYDIIPVYEEEVGSTWTIRRTEITTGASEELVTRIESYRLDNINDPKGIVYNTCQNDDGRSVFYLSLSDLSTRVIGTIPEGYTLTGDELYPNTGTALYANGYVGIYVMAEDAENSELHNGNSMLFIHIDTGDSFILTP